MKLTEAEKGICERYSKRREDGRVRCNECPLVIDQYGCVCKKSADRKQWKEYLNERFNQ